MLIEEYWWQGCAANISINWYCMYFTNYNIIFIVSQYLVQLIFAAGIYAQLLLCRTSKGCRESFKTVSNDFLLNLSSLPWNLSHNCTKWYTDCTFVKGVFKLCDRNTEKGNGNSKTIPRMAQFPTGKEWREIGLDFLSEPWKPWVQSMRLHYKLMRPPCNWCESGWWIPTQNKLMMQKGQSQAMLQCKWGYMVAKFVTNACGSTWWPNL